MLNIKDPDKIINKNKESVLFADKLLNQHVIEYRYFTRLLLGLSTGSLTALISFSKNIYPHTYHLMFLFSLVMLFLSSVSGILVQYQLMVRPLDDAFELLQIDQKEFVKIRLSSIPSKYETWAFRLQVWIFAFSFAVLGISLLKYFLSY